MIISEITTWCIILVGASVLHESGVKDIKTAADAAKALEPLVHSFPNSGYLAKLIFSVGIIGLGFLAVPVLSGSAAYAVADAFERKASLNLKLRKAHMLTPLMIELDEQNKGYQEMPKCVKVIFYDDNLGEKGTITSDYAIRLAKENTITFRKNVVAINAQGETFKSEELVYDQTNKKLFSTKPVQITMTDGNIMYGTGFKSNDSLYPWTIASSTGVFHVDEKQEQGK